MSRLSARVKTGDASGGGGGGGGGGGEPVDSSTKHRQKMSELSVRLKSIETNLADATSQKQDAEMKIRLVYQSAPGDGIQDSEMHRALQPLKDQLRKSIEQINRLNQQKQVVVTALNAATAIGDQVEMARLKQSAFVVTSGLVRDAIDELGYNPEEAEESVKEAEEDRETLSELSVVYDFMPSAVPDHTHEVDEAMKKLESEAIRSREDTARREGHYLTATELANEMARKLAAEAQFRETVASISNMGATKPDALPRSVRSPFPYAPDAPTSEISMETLHETTERGPTTATATATATAIKMPDAAAIADMLSSMGLGSL
jgi:hypothetical protein